MLADFRRLNWLSLSSNTHNIRSLFMLMKAEQSTLLLVDVQARLMPAISQGMEVVERCTLLATIAGLLEVPVIATEQVPDKLGPNVESVRELCRSEERRVGKECRV